MKNILIPALVCVLATALSGVAIDRDASAIQTGALEFRQQEDIDGVGVGVWGETPFVDEQWAFLVKGAYGKISPEYSGNLDYLSIALGFKYYLFPATSFSATGEFFAYDFDTDKDAIGLEFGVKQRLTPADANVAPYVRAALEFRENTSFSDPLISDDSYSEIVFSLGGGVEFKMSDTLSMVLDLVYTESDPSKDRFEDLDGFEGFLGLQYYFFDED